VFWSGNIQEKLRVVLDRVSKKMMIQIGLNIQSENNEACELLLGQETKNITSRLFDRTED
jgi:hypothetical protein